MRRLLSVVFSVLLFLFAIACGGGAPGSGTVTATAVPSAAGSIQPTSAPAAPAAPEATAAPEKAPATIGKVGDRVEANGMALTVMKVSKVDKISDFQKAKAGNTFVVAEVVIENVSAEKAPYNPLYFKVKDADGFEYNAGISSGEQALQSGNLAKGEKVRGNVAFEVKKETKGLVLEYKPIVFGNVEPIKVALE